MPVQQNTAPQFRFLKAAVRSAIDNTGKVILQDHMRHCMVDAVNAGDTEAIDELCQAIDKFMK